MIETKEFLVLAACLALVCSPLAMGWVKPNYFYGVRTRATLASAELWRRVNRFVWLTVVYQRQIQRELAQTAD